MEEKITTKNLPGTQFLFYSLSKDSSPQVIYSFKIYESLSFEIWLNGKNSPPKAL